MFFDEKGLRKMIYLKKKKVNWNTHQLHFLMNSKIQYNKDFNKETLWFNSEIITLNITNTTNELENINLFGLINKHKYMYQLVSLTLHNNVQYLLDKWYLPMFSCRGKANQQCCNVLKKITIPWNTYRNHYLPLNSPVLVYVFPCKVVYVMY